MQRLWATLFAAAAAAAAGEPDAASAEAFYWTGPGGSASRSHRSRARPVYTEVEEAWRLELGELLAPPVYWNATGFVVAAEGGKPELVAFDLDTGEVAARKALKSFSTYSGLQVWDYTAFLMTEEGSLNAYRFADGRFRSPWTYRGRVLRGKRQAPRLPVVHDNELYCIVGPTLCRLRPGSRLPLWRRDRTGAVRRPAIYGPWLFLLTTDMFDVRIEVRRRTDGEVVANGLVGRTNDVVREIDFSITADAIHVRSQQPFDTTGGPRNCARVPLHAAGDRVRLGEALFQELRAAPVRHRLGTLVASRTEQTERTRAGDWEWRLMFDDRRYLPLALASHQPDLFRDTVAPVVLGDVVYFGHWASDLETRQILWRLPVEELSWPVVPADRMVLVVEKHRVLRAFRGRGRR